MGNIGFVALRDLAMALRDELNITHFIETGTWKGHTVKWASGEFEKVTTIEGYIKHYEGTKDRLKHLKNVRFIQGDSREKLRGVISRLRKPACIWLDAHWCGNYEQSQISKDECPLIDELKVLAQYKTRHIIMIDDARLFIEPPSEPHDPEQWPGYDEILALLPNDYHTVIWNDAIISVPNELSHIIDRFTETSELDIVVLTSNKYVHCLPAFAYLFNKFWDAGQAVRVVRYDVRPPKLPGNFTNFAIGNQEDYTWSSGLIRYLQHHDDDLILLMLEDYFIDTPVDIDKIYYCWQLMRQRLDISKIDLTDDRLKVTHSEWDDEMIKSGDDAPFQTSLQAAIWRKDFLLKALKPDENPWQFEKQGTKRIAQDKHLILGCQNPPLSYVNAKGGEGTLPHLWDFKKIPAWMVKELQEKRLM